VAAQLYTRPPITEAVIQIAFSTPTESDLSKADTQFARFYPHHQDAVARNLQIDMAAPTATVRNEERGHRRTSDDQTQIVILWPSSFVFSQLTPYPGWDEFFGRFDRDWSLWKKVMGYHRVSRVGVRYINRIDIPSTGPITEHEKFLNIYPHLPEQFGPLSAYGVQVQLPAPDIESRITINSSSVPSPLLGHSSFIFDQDIAREQAVPQNDEGLYNLLNEIHMKKNAVFEACITDRARELFNT
jgi:uncharacterized protein (TIGR04255 family)